MLKVQVLMESIKTDRVPDGRDLTGLIKSIAKAGGRTQVPVLLSRDRQLIDGLYRMEALRLLSFIHVEAVIAETFAEACEVIDLAHQSAPPPRRIYEIRLGIQDLVLERAKVSVINGNKRRGSQPHSVPAADPRERARVALRQAFKSTDVPRIMQIYTAAARGEAAAISLTRKIDSGVLGINAAVAALRRDRYPGRPRDAGEQRTLLIEAARGLASTSRLLGKLELPLELPPKERDQLVQELIDQRSDLYAIISRIKRGKS